MPQAPQWCASFVKSTQAPLHSVWPPGHPQCPLMHGVPALHATPQVPQLAALVIRSTQAPLQAVCPFGHATTHCPCTHDCPLLHAAPQPPQSFGFVIVSAHSDPLAVSHGWNGQVAAQVPLTQNWPFWQA